MEVISVLNQLVSELRRCNIEKYNILFELEEVVRKDPPTDLRHYALEISHNMLRILCDPYSLHVLENIDLVFMLKHIYPDNIPYVLTLQNLYNFSMTVENNSCFTNLFTYWLGCKFSNVTPMWDIERNVLLARIRAFSGMVRADWKEKDTDDAWKEWLCFLKSFHTDNRSYIRLLSFRWNHSNEYEYLEWLHGRLFHWINGRINRDTRDEFYVAAVRRLERDMITDGYCAMLMQNWRIREHSTDNPTCDL